MDSLARSDSPKVSTLLSGVHGSVCASEVDQIMHILAEQFVSVFITQSAKASRIAERAAFFEVNSIDAFAGRVEQQAQFVLALPQGKLTLCMLLHNGGENHERRSNEK
jgi:hypothetical protein